MTPSPTEPPLLWAGTASRNPAVKNYKYYIGVDIATGSDYTSYCVTKAPNGLQRFWNSLRGKPNARKVIWFGDDERTARKYIRKPNAISYLDGPEALPAGAPQSAHPKSPTSKESK